MSTKWLRESLSVMEEPNTTALESVRDRARNILRPLGALARFDEIAAWVASWQSTERPQIANPTALVFAADHGVARAGTSAYPTEVTASMLEAYRSSKSTLSVFADIAGATVFAFDVGVGNPTGDIRTETAMSENEFDEALSIGRSAVIEREMDLIVIGEMGIGNTTVASALCSALLGSRTSSWVGRGTGVDDSGFERKVVAVQAACTRVQHLTDPIEIFREIGGKELVAMAGAIVAARERRIPVVIDGFVVSAAVLPLFRLSPAILDHCIFSHCSAEPGHRALLAEFDRPYLLDLNMRLGEGSGAMAAVPLIKMACRGVTDVPTFDEWFGT